MLQAYAKYYGAYSSIEGGFVHVALCDCIPGSIGLSIDLTTPDVQSSVRSGALWTRIKGYVDSGFLLGAGSPSGSDRDISTQGIVQGHAYAVLRCTEESDAGGSYQLLQLKNPVRVCPARKASAGHVLTLRHACGRLRCAVGKHGVEGRVVG